MTSRALIPEIDVEDITVSVNFYVDILGFEIEFSRPEEKFTSLILGNACIMLQEAVGPGRRFRTAPLEHPYGRGINIQIELIGIDKLHQRLKEYGCTLVLEPEVKTYRTGDTVITLKQLVVADPDGYLLRLQEILSEEE
jgi:catechol 2,3-dioxygenase-like lactoylglutathione lyase family enzyme